jgi:hypothetical protein
MGLNTSFAVGGGLLTALFIAPAIIPDQRVPVSEYRNDPRRVSLEKFFGDRGCPAHDLAEEFLVASDRHGLDWRLLPSIAFVESTGGKAYRNNNIMGWGSSRQRFSSVRAGIHHVAERLKNSSYYKNKGPEKLLRTYNPLPAYTSTVTRVMGLIGPASLGGRAAAN